MSFAPDTSLSFSAPQKSHEHFGFIDSIRGMAALGIACYHIHRYAPFRVSAEEVLPDFLEYLIRHAWIGVQFFLVIAGFVAAYSLRNSKISRTRFGIFFLRRLIRLGGPYWFVVLLVAVLNYFLVSLSGDLSLSGRVTWSQLLSQLTFLQDIAGYDNISAGMWFVGINLQWGLVFFSLFSLAERFAHQQRPGSVREKFFLSVFFLPPAIFALFIFNLESSMDKWIIYFFHLPFFGVLAWWTLEKRIPAIVFWAYAALLAAGLAVRFRAEVAIGIIAGITLYCAGHSGGIHDWLSIRSLRYLGRISYSLFLIHYPSGWLVTNIGCRVTGDNPYAAVFWLALALVVSVGAAHLLYIFVEKPSFALAERLKSSTTA